MRSSAGPLDIPLVFDVLLQDREGCTTYNRDEIRMSPQSRKSLFQMGNSWRSQRELRPLTRFTNLCTPIVDLLRKEDEHGLASLRYPILLQLDKQFLSIVYPHRSPGLCGDTSGKRLHEIYRSIRHADGFYSPYVLLSAMSDLPSRLAAYTCTHRRYGEAWAFTPPFGKKFSYV